MKTMTVGELREALAGLSDDTKVCFRKWSYERGTFEYDSLRSEGTCLVPTDPESGELLHFEPKEQCVLEEVLVLE